MTKLSAALLLTVALTGSALAQGSPGTTQFCNSYAANASGMGGLAVKKNPACLDFSKGVHGEFKMHFDWCMRTPASSVQGAEANIRRLVAQCTGNAAKPAAAPKLASAPASGSEEPFGQNIGGWRFTQAPNGGNFICRAYSGNNIIGRFSDGRYRLSVLYNANKGKFEGANLEIGGKHEPINVSADGKRLYLEVGDHEIGQIIRANGYKWRAWNSAGSVSFDRSTGAAVSRLRECTKANGGR